MSRALNLIEPPPGLRRRLERRYRAWTRYEAASAALRDGRIGLPEHAHHHGNFLAADAEVASWSQARENEEREAWRELEAQLREEGPPEHQRRQERLAAALDEVPVEWQPAVQGAIAKTVLHGWGQERLEAYLREKGPAEPQAEHKALAEAILAYLREERTGSAPAHVQETP